VIGLMLIHLARRLIVLDETCVKVNGLEYWVYAALDI